MSREALLITSHRLYRGYERMLTGIILHLWAAFKCLLDPGEVGEVRMGQMVQDPGGCRDVACASGRVRSHRVILMIFKDIGWHMMVHIWSKCGPLSTKKGRLLRLP
jgi:hypothetical protein